MKDCNCDLRDGDAKTAVFGSNRNAATLLR